MTDELTFWDIFKTRSTWERQNRKVKKNEIALETKKYNNFEIQLFRYEQTEPYQPSEYTRAFWEYEKIFFRFARKDQWIKKTDDKGVELDNWLTVNENPQATKFYLSNRLSLQQIYKHITGQQIIGVKSSDKTRFIIIDLDFHGKNSELFLDQAEILLNRFIGSEKWHCQVSDEYVTGLHLINVFDRPRNLKTETKSIREILISLDRQHPEVAKKCIDLGMKPFSKIEIYPTESSAVRLPLCRERKIFLDDTLPKIKRQHRYVPDVKKYVQWLYDPNREFLSVDKIMTYILYNIDISPQKRVVVKTESRIQLDRSQCWKGNLFKNLNTFWINGADNGSNLNVNLLIIAKYSRAYGYDAEQVKSGLKELVKSLPESANSLSSRLRTGNLTEIYREIDKTVSQEFEKNCFDNDQTFGMRSSFDEIIKKYPNFDPLTPSTWVNTFTEPVWTEEQKSRFIKEMQSYRFKNDEDIIKLINMIVKKTAGPGCSWGNNFFKTLLENNFSEIKCKKTEKVGKMIHSLELLGVIELAGNYCPSSHARFWRLGHEAMLAVGVRANQNDV
jgi:hypothetical protein